MPLVETTPPRSLQRMQTSPIQIVRSNRRHIIRGITSIPAGKMTPVWAMPLLREDQLTNCPVRLVFESMETAEILMNAVNVYARAYLVPHLVHERFSGMDELNRSYARVANQDGGQITPFFTTAAAPARGSEWPIFKYLGVHAKPGSVVNQTYIEAYNAIWNFRARNRSPSIVERLATDTALAPAFWQHEQFAEIVPDFDQAIIDGEVPLNVVDGALPVKSLPGLGIALQSTSGTVPFTMRLGTDKILKSNQAAPPSETPVMLQAVSNMIAELSDNGITMSLSNLELARKTQVFARLRSQFAGHTDEYIIDMLMSGLTIPDQAMKQPILLAERRTVFGQSKRYASDSGNLTESVVNGLTAIEMNIRCPRVPTGGVVMVVVEIMPEQLFERQADPYVETIDTEALPEYLRDTLDPEKVEVVTNKYIDVAHTVPDGTFGYAPLGHRWQHNAPRVGGKFYRPDPAGTLNDEDRMRIWAVEAVDPVLSEDFYVVNNIHTKPFVVTNQDPFECVIRGEGIISGNTVFGRPLVESSVDWDETWEEAPLDRIDKPEATAAGGNADDAVAAE